VRKPPDPPPGLYAVDPREWTRVWLRVIASPSVKCVGFACAAFADYQDGSEIHPGNVILGLACGGMTKKTVIGALAQMRDWELIWRYREGSKAGRAGLSDIYRLTIPGDIMAKVPMLDPDWNHPVENPGTGVLRTPAHEETRCTEDT
jgi:hypothetical protein